MERVGGLGGIAVEETLASPDPLGYRNHARLTVGSQGRLGYVNRETRERIEVEECLLMTPGINRALGALQGHAQETTQLTLRYGAVTESLMVQPKLHDQAVALETGQAAYRESLLGHTFQVSSPSFFQVNLRQAERLVALVEEAMALTGGEVVVDAYAGVGTFAVLLARRAGRVIAIEESASALEDARVNASGTPNVEIVRGRTENVLAGLEVERPDGVVLDPPRTGCEPRALEALMDLAPRRVVYVSCDPETLARDLKVLAAGPFRIERIQPVDMFPQTHHVECVATLTLDPERREALKARRWLVLASASPRRSEILERLGLGFTLAPTDVPEPPVDGPVEDPVALAQERAAAKAQAAAAGLSEGTVIGADTVVVMDDQVLGKPRDAAQAVVMLEALRGREHRVVTGVALVDAASGQMVQGYRSSRVLMRDYTDEEIAGYVATGDSLDKAGAYGVQHGSFRPAQELRGCYLNVMGLPVCTLFKLLEQAGVLLGSSAEGWGELERCPECVRWLDRARTRG